MKKNKVFVVINRLKLWSRQYSLSLCLSLDIDSPLSNFVEGSCGSRIWLLEQGLRQPGDGIYCCCPLCCLLHSSNECTTSFVLGRQQGTEESHSVKHFVGCWLAIAPLHAHFCFPVVLIALVRKALAARLRLRLLRPPHQRTTVSSFLDSLLSTCLMM